MFDMYGRFRPKQVMSGDITGGNIKRAMEGSSEYVKIATVHKPCCYNPEHYWKEIDSWVQRRFCKNCNLGEE